MIDKFTLRLPTFARLDEYFGVWCIEPMAATRLIDALRSLDLPLHAMQSNTADANKSTMTMAHGRNGKSIAVLSAAGPLMKQRASTGGSSTVSLRRDLRNAVNDPKVQGILLAIDSPGGTTAGTQALADEIKSANMKKPVVAQIEDTGMSAAYWLASQASRIYASVPTTGVGSVGTYLSLKSQPADSGQAQASVRVIRSGPLKGIGEDGMTEEQAAHMQSFVNELNSHFLNAVKTGRGLSQATMDEVGKGGVMLAPEAKQKKLIDGIQSVESTLSQLATM